MSIKNRSDLKLRFKKNAIPTEADFADLIDSVLNQVDDGLARVEGGAVRINAQAGGPQRAIALHADPSATSAANWTLSLNPATTAGSNSPGLGITNAAEQLALFIDPSGKVGVQTTATADHALTVNGSVGAKSIAAQESVHASAISASSVEATTVSATEHIDVGGAKLAQKELEKLALFFERNLNIEQDESPDDIPYTKFKNGLKVIAQQHPTLNLNQVELGIRSSMISYGIRVNTHTAAADQAVIGIQSVGMTQTNQRTPFAVQGLVVNESGEQLADQGWAGYFGGRTYCRKMQVGSAQKVESQWVLFVVGPSTFSLAPHIWGSDYAELFESEDGQPLPVGTSVALGRDGKVRLAVKGDTPIGVVSAMPGILGNASAEWPQRYLKTALGEPVLESYQDEVKVARKDASGNLVIGADGEPERVPTGEFVTRERPALNPDYDPSLDYVPRTKRLEWCTVGLMGQLRLRRGQPVAPTWQKMQDLTDEVELWLVK